jgi:chorismate mutase/prephenate dehydratase
MELDILRQEIDRIDKEIVNLLNQRASVASQIGALKARQGRTIHDPERELSVIENACGRNHGPLNNTDIKEIYSQIIIACRRLQNPTQEPG